MAGDLSMADPATQIAALKQRVAELERVNGQPNVKPTVITRSMIRDQKYFNANKAAIMAAVRKGEVVDDISPQRQARPVVTEAMKTAARAEAEKRTR